SRKITLDLIRRSPVSEGDMFREFQEWCLRTYGDSGKTKTVTRRKYNKILQTLLQGEESGDSGFIENNHVNAKFKFWVKSKGFQVGSSAAASSHSEQKKGASSGKPMLYVPVKSTVSLLFIIQDSTSLKRVAVVEDFFDIIYSMHVEMGSDLARHPRHQLNPNWHMQIAETYAFLPREAVTRFLMSCHECQKRMHINPSGAESKENDRPVSLVPGLIDYNMPITTTYLKQMKLCSMGANEQDESSVSSEDFDMTDPTWMSADHGTTTDLSPSQGERMHTPPNRHKEEDGELNAIHHANGRDFIYSLI
ncbi:nucleolar protein 4-like, partial [Huso huso]